MNDRAPRTALPDCTALPSLAALPSKTLAAAQNIAVDLSFALETTSLMFRHKPPTLLNFQMRVQVRHRAAATCGSCTSSPPPPDP